jgi:hypothetical protein
MVNSTHRMHTNCIVTLGAAVTVRMLLYSPSLPHNRQDRQGRQTCANGNGGGSFVKFSYSFNKIFVCRLSTQEALTAHKRVQFKESSDKITIPLLTKGGKTYSIRPGAGNCTSVTKCPISQKK